jgi:hypothetical protein
LIWHGKTLKSNINSAIYYGVVEKLKTTYPTINCGTEYIKDTKPVFPYIRTHKIDGKQVGETFDGGTDIVEQTYQIDVFTNDKESTCEYIAECVADYLSKNMKIVQQPIPMYESTSEYRYVMRVRWVVGASNTIKW